MAHKNWHFLVVEDDPDGQEVVSTILHHLNLSMDVASNVAEAEELLFNAKVHYQAAIIDLALPGKNGWELLSEILGHSETADLPCVAVTAYHNSKLREDAIKAGFTAYFPKPLNATVFAEGLGDLI